jgi:hypothetical protein
MTKLRSGFEQETGDVGKNHGHGDQPRRNPKSELGNAGCCWAGAIAAVRAVRRGTAIDPHEADREAADRGRDERRLVRRERRQVADPGAADAEQGQDKRNEAAGGGAQGRNVAGSRQDAVAAPGYRALFGQLCDFAFDDPG